MDKIRNYIFEQDTASIEQIRKEIRKSNYNTIIYTSKDGKVETWSYTSPGSMEVYESGNTVEILGKGNRLSTFQASDVTSVKISPQRSITITMRNGRLMIQRS